MAEVLSSNLSGPIDLFSFAGFFEFFTVKNDLNPA
jgi:hypothetical protein